MYFIKYKVVFKFTMVHNSHLYQINYLFLIDSCWSCVFCESCTWLRRWGGLKIGLFPMNLTIMSFTFLLKNQGKFNVVLFFVGSTIGIPCCVECWTYNKKTSLVSAKETILVLACITIPQISMKSLHLRKFSFISSQLFQIDCVSPTKLCVHPSWLWWKPILLCASNLIALASLCEL